MNLFRFGTGRFNTVGGLDWSRIRPARSCGTGRVAHRTVVLFVFTIGFCIRNCMRRFRSESTSAYGLFPCIRSDCGTGSWSSGAAPVGSRIATRSIFFSVYETYFLDLLLHTVYFCLYDLFVAPVLSRVVRLEVAAEDRGVAHRAVVRSRVDLRAHAALEALLHRRARLRCCRVLLSSIMIMLCS